MLGLCGNQKRDPRPRSPRSRSGYTRERDMDDLALARQLDRELNGQPSHTEAEDEAFAQQLAAIDADADLAKRMQAEEKAQAAEERRQREEKDESLALALQFGGEAAVDGGGPAKASKRNAEKSEALRRHLFSAAVPNTEAEQGGAPAWPGLSGAAVPSSRVDPSLSYACVTTSSGGQCGASDEARGHAAPQRGGRPAATAPTPAVGRTVAAWRSTSDQPRLIIDGANVAYSYGTQVHAPSGFDTNGIAAVVEYFSRRGSGRPAVPQSAIYVTLNEGRRDPHDAALVALGAQICWCPPNKDDDVFLIQCAADHGAWVVTNDRWTDHGASRWATAEIRSRRIAYAWMGRTFALASDDIAKFSASLA